MSHHTGLLIALIFSVAIIVSTIVIMRPTVHLNVGESFAPTPAPTSPPTNPHQPEANSTTPTDPPPDPHTPTPTPPNPDANLKTVIEAIYDAVMKAQANVQLNNLNNFMWLFPPDDNGVHAPRTIPIQFGTTVNVPVFTLLHHQNLCIHDLKIKTSLDIEVPAKPEVLNELQDIKNKKYKVKVKRTKKDNTTIEIHLKSTEPTDMYHRMFDKFQQTL